MTGLHKDGEDNIIMDKLKMHSLDGVARNIELIGNLFPGAVTEVMRDGKVERAIDFDVLRQELSDCIVEGREERYQFTWPDKKKAMLAANAPITATLRPVVADSVGRDGTPGGFDSENLYIEGDNLEVLKLLQETYLGKVKMIYIDPPYNTGNDFVYEDDFAQSTGEYMENSGQYDEAGNRMVTNTESNGRFHTDWLNMIYPRLRLAKDLLAEDGLLFISIDENELSNLKKICDDVFGEENFLTCVTRATGTPTGGGFDGLVNEVDYMLIYSKNVHSAHITGLPMSEEDAKIYDQEDERGRYLIRPLRRTGGEDRREDRPTMYFPIEAPDGTLVYPIGPTGYESRWICSPDTAKRMAEAGLLAWRKTKKQGNDVWQVYQKFYLEDRTKAPGNLWNDVEGNKKATRDIRTLFETKKVFDFPKPVGFIKKILQIGCPPSGIVVDFFSGSATTAHAVMQLNAEDGGHRKFIMVQLPELCDEKSEAYKAGYPNICEIGKERIRRAGRKIKEDAGLTAPADLDIGFRCLRLDESNMKPVYYAPGEVEQWDLFSQVDNVKPDRTPEDLLFQVMLDLGVLLSSPIEVKEIDGKKVFNVADGFLLACFDHDVTDETVKAIAQMKPYYAVFRDSSMASDSVATNFDQIFETYSPDTVRKVL